jgi:putative PIN family toxin of toxin-antitoxin system
MRIVIDTNVLVSALLTPSGNPARVLSLALQGRIIFQYDQRILSEYREVLLRDKFGFSRDSVDTLIDFIEHEGEARLCVPTTNKFPDESDRKFWDIACSGPIDALITGNVTRFPRHPRLMNPQAFLSFYIRHSRNT